jgi:hypothetical protein
MAEIADPWGENAMQRLWFWCISPEGLQYIVECLGARTGDTRPNLLPAWWFAL